MAASTAFSAGAADCARTARRAGAQAVGTSRASGAVAAGATGAAVAVAAAATTGTTVTSRGTRGRTRGVVTGATIPAITAAGDDRTTDTGSAGSAARTSRACGAAKTAGASGSAIPAVTPGTSRWSSCGAGRTRTTIAANAGVATGTALATVAVDA